MDIHGHITQDNIDKAARSLVTFISDGDTEVVKLPSPDREILSREVSNEGYL